VSSLINNAAVDASADFVIVEFGVTFDNHMKMPMPAARTATPKAPPILRIATSSDLNSLKIGRRRLHYIHQSDDGVKRSRSLKSEVLKARGFHLDRRLDSVGAPGQPDRCSHRDRLSSGACCGEPDV
jgi:hypothetical protein